MEKCTRLLQNKNRCTISILERSDHSGERSLCRLLKDETSRIVKSYKLFMQYKIETIICNSQRESNNAKFQGQYILAIQTTL